MKIKDLIGKTIIDAKFKQVVGYDDEGFLELNFTDGTSVLIIATYGGYSGKSIDEYPTYVKISEDVEVFTYCSDIYQLKNIK